MGYYHSSYPAQFSQVRQYAIEDYLDQGGNFAFSGAYKSTYIKNTVLFQDYFHAQHVKSFETPGVWPPWTTVIWTEGPSPDPLCAPILEKPMRIRLALALSLLAPPVLPATAHTVLHRFEGFAPYAGFGPSIGLGDVNGDGYGDLLITAPYASPSGLESGSAYVHSGRDGSPLHTLVGSTGEHLGAFYCAPGDVDGDGLADFSVGTYPARNLYTYSGATGLQLHEISASAPEDVLFEGVRSTGDFDYDGVGDLLVGGYSVFPGSQPQEIDIQEGMAWVFSGATGVLIREYPGPTFITYMAHEGGNRFSGANPLGDVDGDGIDDLIVGATDDVNGKNCGLVRVISGATGALIRSHVGDRLWTRCGASVGSAGDWNGDAVPDYFYSKNVATGIPTAPLTQTIFIRSGLDGSALTAFSSEQPTRTSYTGAANLGDVDADGVEDLALNAAWYTGGGEVLPTTCEIRAGGSGALLFHSGAPAFWDSPFAALAPAGDVNADGIGDVVAAGPFDGPFGSATVLCVVPLEIGSAFCVPAGNPPCPCLNDPPPGVSTGCVNSTGSGAMLQAYGANLVSTDRLELFVSQAPPATFGVLLGYAGNPSAATSFGDGISCLGSATLRLGTRPLDQNGEAWMELQLSSTIGNPFGGQAWFQFWFRDANGPCGHGFNVSSGVRITQ